jgi:hypothetical protein
MKTPQFLLLVALASAALAAGAVAANPFLAAPDEKPVSAKFKGTEWNDEIGSKDLPLSARVVTTRIAQAPWGAIFKISFENIASRAKTKRSIGPIYYLATDDEIALLNDDQPEAAAKKLAAEAQAPAIDPNDVHGISTGTRKSAEGVLTETNIAVKGDRCTYEWTHNSGHFLTIVWQKGAGIVEYAQGYGAHKDGFRLKREGARRKE